MRSAGPRPGDDSILRHQGIKEDLNREMKDEYPRSLEYVLRGGDARRDWQDVYPEEAGPPRAYISGGNNLLRRTNHTPKMLDSRCGRSSKSWSSLDQKLCFTGMHSDYLLPAAGYYEKSGIKYADGLRAVPPLLRCGGTAAGREQGRVGGLLAPL